MAYINPLCQFKFWVFLVCMTAGEGIILDQSPPDHHSMILLGLVVLAVGIAGIQQVVLFPRLKAQNQGWGEGK